MTHWGFIIMNLSVTAKKANQKSSPVTPKSAQRAAGSGNKLNRPALALLLS